MSLLDVGDAVRAAGPWRAVPADGLAGFEIRLDYFVVWEIRGARRPPVAGSSVGGHPQVTPADRNPAGVVRFGLHLVQQLAVLPGNLVRALGHLPADPQGVRSGFERVGMLIGG